MRPEGWGKFKTFIYLIGFRTRDLLACSHYATGKIYSRNVHFLDMVDITKLTFAYYVK
jgi:hypothetical protein